MTWSCEHSEYTAAAPERVWALWSNVGGWPAWDEGVERASLDGPFASGVRGRLKPAGGPAVTFELTDVRAPERFADETRLPLARMRFEHTAVHEGDRTRVTHRVTISGPATPLFARVIGRGLARDLPRTVRTLAGMAEREAPVPVA
jgi:uncharacterized protein YndB with AHSA1/START domain